MSTVYYLIGPPGSGKRTIGKELSRLTGAALLDNHAANDPIFLAWGADGQNRIPPEIWTLVGKVREAMLEAVVLAPAGRSHIFTNYLSGHESEWEAYRSLEALAQQRGAVFVPVWLDCPLPELERRMTLPERRERLKLNDPVKLRELLREHGMLTPREGDLVLDSSQLTPVEAAERIVQHTETLQPAHIERPVSHPRLSSLRIGSIVWGVRDLPRAIAFWSATLNYELRDEPDENWAVLKPKNGIGVQLALKVVTSERARRHHLDLYTENQATEVERLLGLGAERVEWTSEAGADYVVLADPDGNRFCVIDRGRDDCNATAHDDNSTV